MKKIIASLAVLLLVLSSCTICRPVIIKHPTEYHFNVDLKGYEIFTEDMKLVGRLNWGENPTLDSLIWKDNE